MPSNSLSKLAVRSVKAALFLLLASSCLPIAGAQQDTAARPSDRERMANRISRQQGFVFEYKDAHPDMGETVEAQLRWMRGVERAFAESARTEGADDSRLLSFSPYVWSFLPMVVGEGSLSDELTERTHLELLIPSLLADLEAVAAESEAGVCELLRIPDLGNGLSRGHLLARVETPRLERLQRAIDAIPAVIGRWNAKAKEAGQAVPRHLRAAVPQLQAYARLVGVELDLRGGRLEHAQVEIGALSSPGALPSGFESMVERVAVAYGEAGRTGAALAMLDLGMLSTTESTWSATDLKALYQDLGGRFGLRRFELALARRPKPLVLSNARFDPTPLVDLETGKPLDPEVLAGRTLVLDFMQLNCQPCMAAVPKVQRFDAGHSDVLVVAIVVDPPERQAKAVQAVRQLGGRFIMCHDPDGRWESMGVLGFPSYIVVSPEGIVYQPFGVNPEPTHRFADVVATLVPPAIPR